MLVVNEGSESVTGSGPSGRASVRVLRGGSWAGNPRAPDGEPGLEPAEEPEQRPGLQCRAGESSALTEAYSIATFLVQCYLEADSNH